MPHPEAPHTRSAGTDCSLLHLAQTGLFVSMLLPYHRLVWSVPHSATEQTSSMPCEGIRECELYTHVVDTHDDRGMVVGIATYLVDPLFGSWDGRRVPPVDVAETSETRLVSFCEDTAKEENTDWGKEIVKRGEGKHVPGRVVNARLLGRHRVVLGRRIHRARLAAHGLVVRRGRSALRRSDGDEFVRRRLAALDRSGGVGSLGHPPRAPIFVELSPVLLALFVPLDRVGVPERLRRERMRMRKSGKKSDLRCERRVASENAQLCADARDSVREKNGTSRDGFSTYIQSNSALARFRVLLVLGIEGVQGGSRPGSRGAGQLCVCGLDTGELRRAWLWDVSNVGVVHGLADAKDHIEGGVRGGRLPLRVAALDGLEGVGVLGPAGAARGVRRVGKRSFDPRAGSPKRSIISSFRAMRSARCRSYRVKPCV